MFKHFFNKDIHFKELLNKGILGLAVRGSGSIFGYLVILIVSNLYGAYNLGILMLSITILNVCAIVPKFGFENSIVRILGELKALNKDSQIRKVILICLLFSFGLSLVCSLIIYGFSGFISTDILNKVEMEEPLKIIAFGLPLYVITSVVGAYFQGLKKNLLFLLFQTSLLMLVYVIILVVSSVIDLDYSLVELYLSAILIVGLTSMVFLFRSIGNFNKEGVLDKVKAFNFSRILRISTPMLFAGSFFFLIRWSDTLILGIYNPSEEIGIYSGALRLSLFSNIVLIAVNSIAAPKYAEFFAKKDIFQLGRIIKQSTALIFYSSIPLLALFIVFPEFFMNLYGEEFSSGSIILIIFSISQLVAASCGSVGLIMQMTNQQNSYQYVTFVVLVLNIVLNFIFIPKFGMLGAAVSSLISFVIWNVSLVIIIKRTLKISTHIRFFKMNN